MRERLQQNLWHWTGGEPINAAPLDRHVVADVVIVGGGFTGCSAALHLAEAGINVLLLEAQTIGHGGSGRNVGLVNAGLWTPPGEVEQVLGRDSGQRLNGMLAGAPDLVFDLLDAAGSRRLIGSDAFYGALFDPRAGTIQPLAYVRGLARAASAAGATLYEHSPANSFKHESGVWKVNSEHGTIIAQTLIQATDSYECRPKQPPTLIQVRYFQCATPPLSGNLRAEILPGGEGCWDTGMVMSSFRLDDAGRMIIGAVGSLEGASEGTHRQWAARKLVSLFPALGGQRFEYCWGGRIGMTSDHLPRVIELGPRGIAIYGYSGRGIGPGSAFGKAAAAWACDNAIAAFPMPISPPCIEPFTSVKKCYFDLGSTLTHLFDARLRRRTVV